MQKHDFSQPLPDTAVAPSISFEFPRKEVEYDRGMHQSSKALMQMRRNQHVQGREKQLCHVFVGQCDVENLRICCSGSNDTALRRVEMAKNSSRDDTIEAYCRGSLSYIHSYAYTTSNGHSNDTDAWTLHCYSLWLLMVASTILLYNSKLHLHQSHVWHINLTYDIINLPIRDFASFYEKLCVTVDLHCKPWLLDRESCYVDNCQ